jgi:hypothetical protein
MLSARLGDEALRYAITTACFAEAAAAFFYFRAAGHLRREDLFSKKGRGT